MAGHRNVSILFDDLTSEQRSQIEVDVRRTEADMFLAGLRREAEAVPNGQTRRAVVDELDVAAVAGLDVGALTFEKLREIVRTLGAELEVTVVLPNGDRLTLGTSAQLGRVGQELAAAPA